MYTHTRTTHFENALVAHRSILRITYHRLQKRSLVGREGNAANDETYGTFRTVRYLDIGERSLRVLSCCFRRSATSEEV